MDLPPIEQLSEVEVKEILEDFVGQSCCHSFLPLSDMVVTNIQANNTYHVSSLLIQLLKFQNAHRNSTTWILSPNKGQRNPITSHT